MNRFDKKTSLRQGDSLWPSMADIASAGAGLFGGPVANPLDGDANEFTRLPEGVVRIAALKFVCLVPKPPLLSAREFHAYWLEKHGPLVQSVAGALRMKRYVQSHRVASPTIDGFGAGRDWAPNPYRGMTELWWDSEVEMAEAFASPEGREASALLAADEKHFSDNQVIVWGSQEYEIFSFT